MMRKSRKISLFVVAGFCLAGLPALSLVLPAKKAPTAEAAYSTTTKGYLPGRGHAASRVSGQATYSISIKGYLTGSGTASLNGKMLTLTGTVADDQGNKGDFSAPSLTVDAKNHFTGTGTALGQVMKLSGRLDAVAAKETTLKTDRIVCNYKLPSCDGRGRVAGFVPADPVSSTRPPEGD